jgi:UDP-2,3-diacylglucosamine hydrolase
MKFSVISDIHIKKQGDAAEDLLISFLNNKEVLDSDGIFLLGDIFDLMIGPHSQYFSRFNNYFNTLKKILEQGKRVYYIEGNHDFHLNLLYQKFFQVHDHIDSSLFQMHAEFILHDNSKSIYLAHGDDIEIRNIGQIAFKGFVTSLPLHLYANYLMPYFLITKVGEYSSEVSRNRNQSRYTKDFDVSRIKENFRLSAEKFIKKNHHDIIVLGHSHVQDHYYSENKFEYVNNGYAQHTQTYISIENGQVAFKKIKQ